MERVVANFSGRVRKTTLNGRQYLVAPLTLIVPGVLNGSQGPLYYPSEEVGRNPSVWDRVPIVVYHPHREGHPVSAHAEGVLDSQGIGEVRNTKHNGKLVAEGWFDVEKTRRVDNRILKSLLEERPIELSTGLFTDNEPAPVGANYNGRSYSYIARNHRPDHLAILPDQVGACSIQDGCGVLVNGGSGSGNFGHSGRPGEVGGSGEGSDKKSGGPQPVLEGKPPSVKDVNKLRDKLGGTVVDIARHPDVGFVLSKGKLQVVEPKDKIRVPMKDGQCHWNVAKLYSRGKVDSIVIGYTSCDDVGWHQHTWGLKEGKIVETTKSNNANASYFGAKLSSAQAKKMVEHAKEVKPGEGRMRYSKKSAYDLNESAHSTETENAFCPTGEGGGIDPTCSSGGGGDRERLRDRIEGTQKEADNEVKKAKKEEKKARDALEKAEKELEKPTSGAETDSLQRSLSEVSSRKAEQLAKLAGHREKIAKLKAMLQDAKKRVENAQQPHSKETGKFKRPNAGTGKGEYHEAAQRGGVHITDEQRELGADAKSQKEAGSNPPSWAVDEAIWERAKAAADKGDYGEDSYWAVVVHIYQNMGGGIERGTPKGWGAPSKGTHNKEAAMNEKQSLLRRLGEMLGLNQKEEEEEEEELEEEETTQEECDNEDGCDDKQTHNQGGSSMDHTKLVSEVIANVCCWKEEDRPILNSLSDETLNRLIQEEKKKKEFEAVVNAVKEGTKGLVVNEMPAFLKKKLAEKASEEEEEPVEEEEPKKGKVPVKNAEKPVEYVLTAQDREDIAFARQIKQREKDRAITAITANARNSFKPEELQKMPLEMLVNLARLATEEAKEPAAVPSYFGASVPATNQDQDLDPKDILLPPTINWAEEAAARKAAV